jgi:hypothetical protein
MSHAVLPRLLFPRIVREDEGDVLVDLLERELVPIGGEHRPSDEGGVGELGLFAAVGPRGQGEGQMSVRACGGHRAGRRHGHEVGLRVRVGVGGPHGTAAFGDGRAAAPVAAVGGEKRA